MPRTCTVCTHAERVAIDEALIAGASYRDIAGQFHVSKTAVARHQSDHVAERLTKAKDAEDVAQADSLLAQVQALQTRTLKLLDTAEEAGELQAAVAAIRAAKGNLELLAKLRGELDERPQVNIVASVEWVQVRSVLLRALAPYADARATAAAALVKLEVSSGH